MTTNEEAIRHLENRIELIDDLEHAEQLIMFSTSYPMHYKLLKALPDIPRALLLLRDRQVCELVMCEEQAWLNYLEYAQEVCRDPFNYMDDLQFILNNGLVPFMTLKWCDLLCTHLVTQECVRLRDIAGKAHLEHVGRAVLRSRDSYTPGDFSVTYHHVDDQHHAGTYWKVIHDMGLAQSIRGWVAEPVLSINPLSHTNFRLHPEIQAIDSGSGSDLDQLIIQEVTEAVCQGWKQYVDEKLDQYAAELQRGVPCQARSNRLPQPV